MRNGATPARLNRNTRTNQRDLEEARSMPASWLSMSMGMITNLAIPFASRLERFDSPMCRLQLVSIPSIGCERVAQPTRAWDTSRL